MNDFEKLLKQAADPDKLAESLASISDMYKNLEAKKAEQDEKIKKQDEQIASLRDTNMKLFLRTTNNTTQEEQEETDEYQEIINKINK